MSMFRSFRVLFRGRSGLRKPRERKAAHIGLMLETLEPRLLMSGDLALQHMHAAAAVDLTLTLDAGAKAIVVLDNNHGGAEVERIKLDGHSSITISGTKGDDVFRIALDPSLVRAGRITIDGGNGNDSIVGPVAGTSWALGSTGAGEVGSITFRKIEQLDASGTGKDTLTGPHRGATWTLDGNNSGSLLRTSFSGIDRFVGSNTAPDVFKIHPLGGSTVGSLLNHGVIEIDGGSGSVRDRIIVEGNRFLDARFTRTGSGAGTFEIDGVRITHTGIETVRLGSLDATQAVVKDATFTAQADDVITIGDDASDGTQVSVTGSASGDTTTIAKPTGSLTIAAPGENGAVTVNSLTLHGVDLSITAGSTGVSLLPQADETNAITLSANSYVDTSVTSGVAGDVSLQAMTISLDSGAGINALGTSGGAVKLIADHRRVGTGFIIDQLTNSITSRTASITIDGADISGGSISLQALAGDWSLDGKMGDFADGAPEGVLKVLEGIQSFAGIPVSVLVKRSTADISISNSSMLATGDLSIDANAESDGIGSGTFFRAPAGAPGGLAFVYVQTDATANIDLDRNTIVSQNGDVNITTEGTTNASGVARVSQNFAQQGSPTNPQNVQAAAAVGNVTLVSTITLEGASAIEAFNGAVNIAATGNNSNEPSAETESYKDGLAGFTLGLALSDATVSVTTAPDVRIRSGETTSVYDIQQEFNPFTAIDPIADTVAVNSTVGYETDDAVSYGADAGGAAPGLTDAQTYYVVVVDPTHFQLAATRADALAGTVIDLGALPSLETIGGQHLAFSQIQESTNSIVFDYDPGLTVGQKLYYDAQSGQYVGGLEDKNTGDPTTVYTVASIGQSTGGNQWLVALVDSGNNAVALNLDPALLDASGNPYAFSLNGSALVLAGAQAGFATGQPFTYRQALGFDIPTLVDGTTYYLVKDSTDTTNTVFRLADSAADAAASDGYSNTEALGHVNTNVTSDNEHLLQAVNSGGVSITATLVTTEEAGTKSGQGGEPETSDASKGEMLPILGNLLKNVSQLATLPNDQSGNLVDPMDQRIANNAPSGSGSNSNFGVVATVAFVKSSNTAKVEIGGIVQSGAGITAAATITHTIQTQAEGVKSPTQAGDTTLTIAGAAAVGLSYDNAQVIIDDGALIDASGATNLNASVSYPFIAPLDSPKDFFGYVLNQFTSNPLSTLSGFLGNVFLLKQDLVNSWARSVDNDPAAKISIAGAVDFQSRTTFATVDVMGGAQINQNIAYRDAGQSLSLFAETQLNMINVGGIFDYDLSPEGLIKSYRSGPSNSIQPYGAQGGKAGFGGAYRQLELQTTTHTIIHGADTAGNATAVYTAANNNLTLEADNSVFVLGITQSGTSAGQFGVSGSAAYNHQVTDTVAAIEAGATIDVGYTDIDASDRSTLVTFSGDVVKGKNLGFGVSFVYNDIDRSTQAYVGAADGATPASAGMTVVALSISAENTGHYLGFALASATADTNATPAGGTTPSAPPDPSNPVNNTPVNPSPPPATGNYGLAVSGDIVFNQVTDVTAAVINQNAGIKSAGQVILLAQESTELLALTGTAAIAEGSNASAGLAGSYSENRFIGTTLAEVKSDSGLAALTIENAQLLSITASQTGFASAVAAGGSGGINHADGSAEIAGSVAINVVTPVTTARLVGTTVTTSGPITISATDSMPIYALAGAATFGGKQGFGAAVAMNLTTWTSPITGTSYAEAVAAQIHNSYISQTGQGTIAVAASITDPSNVDRIVAVAGSLGQGSSIGVSGTVAVNDLGAPSSNAVEASISGSNVYASSDPDALVSLSATIDQTVLAIGGEVALATGKSSSFALGAGMAYNETNLPVQAFVSFSNLSARTLVITATIDGTTTATSAGLAVATNGVGVAGSAAVNVIGDQVAAYIDGLASTQKVVVVGIAEIGATYDTDFTAAAGELAAGTNAGGAAVAVNVLNTGTRAYVGVATVQLGRWLGVTANTGGKVVSVAVGAVAAENFALGGSVAVTATNSTTEAYAAGTDATDAPVSISTPASIAIEAQSAMTFITVGGTLAAAAGYEPGAGSVGVANATLLRKDRTQAWASNGSISYGGANEPIDVQFASAGKVAQVTDFTGLSISAISTDMVTTASGGASLNGAEPVGAAGSASVTILDKATQATLGNSLSLPGADALSANVLAYDDSEIGTGAGGLAGGAETGVGAAVDVISITKNTTAQFAPQGGVTIGGNLTVQALSKENLLSVAVGASILNELAIAGAASTYVLDLSTTAAIGDTDATQITVDGSAQVAAQDDTVVNQFPGGLDVAAETGVGAAVAVVDVKSKLVDASVASGVTLVAHANPLDDAILAATGEFDVGFTTPSGQKGDVQPPDVHVDLGKQTGDSDAPAFDDKNLTLERTATPVFEATRGIAISAINTAKIKTMTFAVGGGGEAAVNVDASTHVVNMTTTTRVLPNVSLESDGDVVLAAGADLQKLGVTGSAAVSGTASGAAGVDVTIIAMNTGTDISGGSTTITAGAAGDLIVNAQAQEDILAITAGFAASGMAGLDVVATVVKVDNTTYAGISAGAASLSAGGNVVISAADDTSAAEIAGDVAIGLGGGAFGGSTVVTLITKNTTANVADGASIDALANNGHTLTVLDGTVADGNTGFETKTVQGVVVQAESSENVAAIAVGGGGGLYFGAGAGATYTLIDSNTSATVGTGVADIDINQAGGGSANQGVSITASNRVDVLTVGGGLGLGTVGIGGGVDVGIIRNDTNATLGTGAKVSAAGEVDLFALELIHIDSYALSAGLSAITGVTGSVSVWTIGTGVSSSYTDSDQSADSLGFSKGHSASSSVPQSADAQTQRSDITTLLGSYGNTGGANGGQIGSVFGGASDDYAAVQPDGAVQAGFSDTSRSGVNAEIGNGVVIDAGALDVAAFTTVVSNQTSGGISAGLGAVGASVSVLNRGDTTQAFSDATVSVGGALAVTAGSVSVVTSDAYGGNGGLLVALGAQVAVVNDDSAVMAILGSQADVQRADGGVLVAAGTNSTVTVVSKGISGGLLAAGAGVAEVDVTGSTVALLQATAVNAGYVKTGSVVVDALSDITVDAESQSSVAGVIGAVGNVSHVDIAPTVTAAIDSGPAAGTIDTLGAVLMTASSTIDGTATADGLSVGGVVSVGVSYATAAADSNVSAYVGANNSIDSGGLQMSATASDIVTADGTANAGYTLVGAGVGVHATADITNQTSAYILGNVTTTGSVAVIAQHTDGAATANATGIVGQGLVDVGYSYANANTTSTVLAYLDQGTVKTTDGGSIVVLATEGDDGSPTGPTATSTSSQGVYAGGDELQSQASTTHTPIVLAGIGDPLSTGASTAVVSAQGDLTLTAGSWTIDTPQALTPNNDAFTASSQAEATATATKTTQVVMGAGAQASAGGTAALTAISTEDLSPLATGADGDGIYATGLATTTVSLSRETTVSIGAGATLTAGTSIALVAESTTQSDGALQDNQGKGAFNSTFHAGEGDAAQAQSHPVSTFNLGYDGSSTFGVAATSIFISGTLTAPTISLQATTTYAINVQTFSWVTADAFSEVTAGAFANSQDDVNIQFSDTGKAIASQSVSLDAGYTEGSFVNLFTKLHYSELGGTYTQDTNATTNLFGDITLIDNDDLDAITSPVITSRITTDPGVKTNWDYTVGSENDHSSDGSHTLKGNTTIAGRNDWNGRTSSSTEAAEPPSTPVWASNTVVGGVIARLSHGGAGQRPDLFAFDKILPIGSPAVTDTDVVQRHDDGSSPRAGHSDTRPASHVATPGERLLSNARQDRSTGWILHGEEADNPAEDSPWIELTNELAHVATVSVQPKIQWAQ